MTLQVRFTVVEGSALRFPGAIPMMEGDTAMVAVTAASDKSAPSIEDIVTGASNAPAMGVDGVQEGIVSVTAIGGSVKVREYLEVNPFAADDNEDGYEDHALKDGESVTAATIASNAKTLVVLGSL